METAAEAYQQGRYGEAERLYLVALKEAEEFEAQDPRLAASLNDLGDNYWCQGKYAEAETLLKRALAIWENALGPEDPEVAVTLNNLGLIYKAQGRYVEAETHHRRSLKIKEKTLGLEHPRLPQA